MALLALCVADAVLHSRSAPHTPAVYEAPFCPVAVDRFAQAFNARAQWTGWEPRLMLVGCEPDKDICRYRMTPKGTLEAHGRIGDTRTRKVLFRWPTNETPIADISSTQSLVVDLCAPTAGLAEHTDIARRSIDALATLPATIAIPLHHAVYTMRGDTNVVSLDAATD